MNKVKLTSFCFLLLFTNCLFAQFYGGPVYQLKHGQSNQSYWRFWDADYLDGQQGLLTIKKRKALGVQEITLKRTDNKGKSTVTKLKYNESGFLLSSKGNKFERKSEYLNDTLETYQFIKSKNKTSEFKISFDDKGKTLIDERFENGKLISKTENTYSKTHLIYAKLNHKGKLYEMKYTYNTEDKLIKTEYFKKGKLKQSWVYECKPEGQLVASNKTELISSKCEFREESADGSFAIFTRTIKEGKPYLQKDTYTKDSVRIKEEYFTKDTILTYRRSFINNVQLSQSYKNGKLKWEDKSVFNEQHKCIEQSSSRKNKEKSKYVYAYNSQQNEILFARYWKGKLKFQKNSQYDAKGNKILEENTNRKDKKITSKTINEYNENGTLKTVQYYSKGKLTAYKEFEFLLK